MADDPNGPWFEQLRLGQLGPIHWKGWVCIAALAAVLVCGAVLDDVMSRQHNSILRALVMIPVGALALTLAWTIAGRTRR